MKPSQKRTQNILLIIGVIVLALLPLWTVVGDWIHVVNAITMTIAVILTVASGIDYVVTEVRGARASGASASRRSTTS